MSRPRLPRWAALSLRAGLLATLLLQGTARAAEPPPPPATAPLSEEDREVVENLELLESMEAADALDVLLELDDAAPPTTAPPTPEPAPRP